MAIFYNKSQVDELIRAYKELEKEKAKLIEENTLLQEKYDVLLHDYCVLKENQKKAGRKKEDDIWKSKFNTFLKLKQEGKSSSVIMQEMEISKATYYRYQKVYNERIAGASEKKEV